MVMGIHFCRGIRLIMYWSGGIGADQTSPGTLLFILMKSMNLISGIAAAGDRVDADHRRRTLEAMSVNLRSRAVSQATQLPSATLSSWLDFAERNLVGPLVAHVIIDALGSGALDGRAQRLHQSSLSRISTLMNEMDTVASRLSQSGIRLVGLKNAGIARGICPCSGCCPMGDIDVLVPRSRFEESHRLVVEEGFTLASRGTVESATLEAGMHSGGTEYIKKVGEHEVWLELQWRPVAGRWLRPEQEPDGEEFIEHSVPIEGTAVRLLRPVDNMLQVALHTAKHSFVRAPGIRLHTDVDRLASYTAPQWDDFASRVEDLNVTVPVFFSLFLAVALLGALVPEHTLRRLAPPRWRQEAVLRWLMHVDLFEPQSNKFSRPAMMMFHALLYDDARTLMASVLDTSPDQVGLRDLPGNLRRGVKRMHDLLTRYQA